MDKFKEIRPIVLGIAKKDNKILVSEGYDKIKDQTFYRCLGGGIEFWETSQKALKREYKEELGIDIEVDVDDFCGIAENIFTYQGKNAHEIIIFYNIKIKENDIKEKYHIVDDNCETDAYWIDIDEFKNNNKILYPEQIFKYL